MSLIKVVGFDPSFRHWGVAHGTLDIITGELKVDDLKVIEIEGEAKKGVIKTSDDLRCARDLQAALRPELEGVAITFTEVPLGNAASYNNAIFGAGVVIGILGSLQVPLIQVFPQDVKKAMTGIRDACKEEMIEAAMLKHPTAPWLMRKFKGTMRPTAKNEHLADAIAAIHAGVQTQQYKQLVQMFLHTMAA